MVPLVFRGHLAPSKGFWESLSQTLLLLLDTSARVLGFTNTLTCLSFVLDSHHSNQRLVSAAE